MQLLYFLLHFVGIQVPVGLEGCFDPLHVKKLEVFAQQHVEIGDKSVLLLIVPAESVQNISECNSAFDQVDYPEQFLLRGRIIIILGHFCKELATLLQIQSILLKHLSMYYNIQSDFGVGFRLRAQIR